MINKPYHNDVFDANKTFFTSDLHFGHKNIIKYCNRPHSSVDIMNERIVELWNRYIPEDADVFILGDVAFSMSKNKIREILNSMNGRKHLVIGNHDELVADTNGKYYEMWEAQAQYYRKKGMDKAFALT